MQGFNKQKRKADKIMPRRRSRNEGKSSVHLLKEKNSALSMPLEVNTVAWQKQRAVENGFHGYITGRLKINRAIYSL